MNRNLKSLVLSATLIVAAGSGSVEAGVRHWNRTSQPNSYPTYQPNFNGTTNGTPVGYGATTNFANRRHNNCNCYQSQAYKGFITRIP